MNSLFLTPQFNKFRIIFPKSFIPEAIYQKWYNVVNRDSKNFLRDPIDLINESIQSVEFTGISEGSVEQQHAARNMDTGRVEPTNPVSYRSPANPISQMENTITVSFRHTDGFYSYFLLFESWFHHHMKTTKKEFAPFLVVEILGSNGEIMSHVILDSPIFNSIDSLSLSFNRVNRESETFNCTFKYSDIDFELGPASANENLELEM